jgi:hypothetical protein
MLRAAPLLALAVLAGCASPSGGWTLQASAAAGTAMVYRDVDLELRIACRRDPADLFVSLEPPGVWPFKIASRDGAYEITSYARGGASDAITDQTVEALATGVSVVAGERRIDPPSPPEDVADAFRAACRKARP